MATKTAVPAIDTLRDRLGLAVRQPDVTRITASVKRALTDMSRYHTLPIPESFRKASAQSYARRLLHRDPVLGYTVVVMTWGPGQHTQLHDHAGIWCVECVVEGQLNVTQYEVVEEKGDRYRFVKKAKTLARVGDAGCLIPPFEYHTLENALDDRTSITLHVYGGEMETCNLYTPEPSGWWIKGAKRLEYDH